jgi:DNA polymerase-3 subunit alpha
MDFDGEGREKVLEWIVEEWGRDNVANIGTQGTFGTKSLTRRYFKLTEPENPAERETHYSLMQTILGKIPPPLFGKEATFKEIIEGNPDKNYPEQPELTIGKYKDWHDFCYQLEGMVSNYGVHAAGMVINNTPIANHVPVWRNKDYERITQFEMGDTEAQGLIKFDFLVIKNLDILKRCVKLIRERHNKVYDIYTVPDGDPKAYKLFADGHLTGVFQFEESASIKRASLQAQPKSIGELSDITSLVRPGPSSAGFLDRYLNNDPDPEIPEAIQTLWKDTRNVLVYQEQLMLLFVEIAGLDLVDSDLARRAIGKKDLKYLATITEPFKKGCQRYGLNDHQIDYLWAIILGCGEYLFNKSHAVAYSYVSYLCAYFKANYPTEFFCSLMSVRSEDMMPKDWAAKAPEYIIEARELGIRISPPSVQKSYLGFHIVAEGEIYFGLNGIRSCGKTASQAIISARGKLPFKDINDFIERVNTQKINTKVFESLVNAGAFDTMGYLRQDLLAQMHKLYDFKTELQEFYERKAEIKIREKENLELEPLIARRTELKKIEARKKDRELTAEELEFLETTSNLRKKVSLKEKEFPTMPTLERHSKIPITLHQMMIQQEYIGCFLGRHPARMIYSEAEALVNVFEGVNAVVCGMVIEVRDMKTKKGQPMAILEIGDGTATAKIILFPRSYAQIIKYRALPEVKDLIKVSGKVSQEAPIIEIFADTIDIYKG